MEGFQRDRLTFIASFRDSLNEAFEHGGSSAGGCVGVPDEEAEGSARLSRSRTEPASRVERVDMLTAYRETPFFCAVRRDIGVTHQNVERCVRRGERLDVCLATLAQGTLCKILAAHKVKPHKVRYYLERRDPEFDARMAEVLCVYREVQLVNQSAPAREGETPGVAIVSSDEKPGVQAIGTTAPDLPPVPSRHERLARDHEYTRHGTSGLLAGIDLLSGVVHASVEERHRSREFAAFLLRLDATYPPSTAIKLIFDNHSARVSRETKAWLAAHLQGRFTFVFLPKHGPGSSSSKAFSPSLLDRRCVTSASPPNKN